MPIERQSSIILLLRRIWAIPLRHIYLHMGSWPRIVEMMYWPLVNMASWGFTSVYLTKAIGHVEIVGSTLIAAVVLMEFFMRPTMMVLTLFMEELWSRNLGHLFASPLRVSEYMAGLVITTLVRTSIALTPLLLIAHYVFGFSLFSLGWAAAIYVPLLALNGCICGSLIIALLLRLGLAAEWLAWMATMMLAPFFAPYYPVEILPQGFQLIARVLPPTYVFESMKSQMATGDVQPKKLLIAFGLTVIYALIAAFVFRAAYRSAKRRGGLLQSGE
jgi:ABC-2 type transport system permease protein